MSLTVKEIKDELTARIVVCNGIANGGYTHARTRVKMRAKIITLQAVLSWITGQEQLGCQYCQPNEAKKGRQHEA